MADITNVRLIAQMTLTPVSPGFPGGSIQADGPTLAAARTSLIAIAQARLDAEQGNLEVLQEFINGT